MVRYRTMRGVVASLLMVIAASAPSVVQAQQGRCVERLTEEELDARYDFILSALEGDEQQSKNWYFGWLTTYALLGSFNTQQAFNTAPRKEFQREYQAVGAVGSWISLIGMAVMPMPTVYAAKRLRDMPGETLSQRRSRLRRAEKLLEQSAKVQQMGDEGHMLGWLWGIGTAVLLGVKYDVPWSAFASFLGAAVLTEVKIATQPKGAIKAWDAYIYSARNCIAPTYRENRTATFSMSAGGTGLGLSLNWF